MRRLALAAAVLLCAFRVQAGAIGGPSPGVAVLAAPTNTDFDIDIFPDTQNQSNPGTIAEGDGVVPRETDCSTVTECTEPWCTHTDLCGNSWNEEGMKVLDAQMAMVRGEDSGDPWRATAILHVGDIVDWFDTGPTKRRDDPCNATEPGAKNLAEWDADEVHLLAPLRATKIPTVIAHGNHDANGCYEQRVVTPWAAMPYFYSSTVDATNLDAATIWAVKAPTRVGTLCLLTAPYQFYTQTRDAAKTLSGCGGSFPTMVVKHDIVDESGNAVIPLAWSKTGAADDLVDRAGHAYIWMVTGGHYTTNCGAVTNCSFKGSYTGADSGAQIFFFEENWQEKKRHEYNEAYPYGVTPADGGDGEMTRIHVSPSRKFLHAYDYNPIRHAKGPYRTYIKTSELYVSFDWCARFGGC